MEHLRGRAAVEDRPFAHAHEIVRVPRRLVQLMQYHDDRLAVRLVQMLHEAQHLHLMRHVEEARRLVEEEDLRVLRDRHRDPRALTLPARHRADGTLRERRHIRFGKRPVDHLRVLLRRP